MTATIDKREYYIRALNAGCYRYKQWVIELFSWVDGALEGKGKPYPYALTRHNHDDQLYYTFTDPATHEEVRIKGTATEGQPFHFMDEIKLNAGEVPNIHQPVTTRYGNLLVNFVCLVYAFGDKVEFMPGPMTVAKMEAVIEKRLADTPPSGHERDPSKLYIDEFKLFNDGVRHLEGFSQLCVPSASKKTMTVSPEVIKRRDELFKQHAHELDDPLVQAKIDKELIAMEKKWMEGDPGQRFYIKSKSYDVVRKKLFLYQGQESGFGKVGKVITSSLTEGWDVKNLPAMANALRNGSYSRGFLTALGGVEAKGNYRIFQNTVVAEEDCGSKLGIRITLTQDMAKHFISSSVIEKDGSLTELTDQNLNEYVGKPITVRSVAYCKTANQNVCAVCVGKKIAQTPTAISTYASDLGSLFLSLMLAAMHGVALKTATVNYINDLR
jgi:hypothetical protein